jgi:hypothetical protein
LCSNRAATRVNLLKHREERQYRNRPTCTDSANSRNLEQTISAPLHGGGQGFESPRLHYKGALSICKTTNRERFSGCLWAVPQRVAEAKSFRLLGGEDEGHFRCTLAVYAPHRDVGTSARVHLNLVLRYGFGGAAVGAAKALLPRDPCRAAFLLVRELGPANHVVSLLCPDTQTLLEQRVSGWGRDKA